MRIEETSLPGVMLIKPDTYTDKRGWFHVLWDYRELNFNPVYQFSTFSRMGTLRGLHAQKRPHMQTKIVQVTEGSLFDVVVSVEDFGLYEVFYVTPQQHLLIPPGYLHGFYVGNAYTDVVYLLDDYHYSEYELSVDAFDKDLGIPWPIRKDVDLLMSDKDMNGISYADALEKWYE